MKRGWRKEAGRLAIGLLAADRPVWRKKGGAVCIPHSAGSLQPRRIPAISRSGS
jgi:hypothetical protein